MTRRRSDFQQLHLDSWPSVDDNTLVGKRRDVFRRRQRAVALYAEGLSLREIVKQTQIERRQLYRLLERCLAIHQDGRPFGFRALIPNQWVRNFTRQ